LTQRRSFFLMNADLFSEATSDDVTFDVVSEMRLVSQCRRSFQSLL
jgi:hypothetical protein